MRCLGNLGPPCHCGSRGCALSRHRRSHSTKRRQDGATQKNDCLGLGWQLFGRFGIRGRCRSRSLWRPEADLEESAIVFSDLVLIHSIILWTRLGSYGVGKLGHCEDWGDAWVAPELQRVENHPSASVTTFWKFLPTVEIWIPMKGECLRRWRDKYVIL